MSLIYPLLIINTYLLTISSSFTLTFVIKTVIFDLDGLLINSEPLWHEAEKAAFKQVGINLTHQMCLQNTGLRINEVVQVWYDAMPWQNKSTADVTNDVLDKLLLLIANQATLMDGVVELLDFFGQMNLNLAVASSSPTKVIHAALAKFNLLDSFHALFSAQHLPYGKPHPAVFLETAAFFHTPPKQCLVFEDSFNGLIAAKAARMKTIAVPEEAQFNETRFDIADFKLHSLAQFTPQHWQALQNLI
ncbi:MAG: hexitol phosphatase HxpB [Sphingobacteriales bacterium]|nr:hexitol phosphatase HxpB [Sphingobacteriales bacterium]